MPISLETHLTMIAFVVLLVVATLILGWRARRVNKLDEVSTSLGVTMLSIWIVYNAYYFYPSNFDWAVSLPLHACDLIAPITGIVLINSWGTGRAVLYFSALSLTTQALVTPTGNQDPTTFRFWLYWLLHGGIIACSFFDVFQRDYEPTKADFVRVLKIDAIYVSIILPVNVVFSWNYGYIGPSEPDGATLIDILGPWPERVVVILSLTVVAQFSMLLAWKAWEIFRKEKALKCNE